MTVRFVPVAQNDELAAPLLADLADEYAGRYGATPAAHLEALRRYPAREFEPPAGGLLVGLVDGLPVTGGGFRQFDEQTAELKRIWTHPLHRRRGLATVLLAELELEIARRGYRRIYLMTGDRQPEAERLYEATGYARLQTPLPARGPVYPVAFVKAVRQEVSQ